MPGAGGQGRTGWMERRLLLPPRPRGRSFAKRIAPSLPFAFCFALASSPLDPLSWIQRTLPGSEAIAALPWDSPHVASRPARDAPKGLPRAAGWRSPCLPSPSSPRLFLPPAQERLLADATLPIRPGWWPPGSGEGMAPSLPASLLGGGGGGMRTGVSSSHPTEGAPSMLDGRGVVVLRAGWHHDTRLCEVVVSCGGTKLACEKTQEEGGKLWSFPLAGENTTLVRIGLAGE